MASAADAAAPVAYVFGYGSLVELTQPLTVEGRLHPAVPGSGLKPKVAVAYLDVAEAAGETVNGLAIPVDPDRLAELDLREGNYRRVEVSAAFEPALARTAFVFHGTDAARARATENGEQVYVSRQYVERVRRAFTALGPGELDEYDRSTGPPPFPERDLEPRYPQTAP